MTMQSISQYRDYLGNYSTLSSGGKITSTANQVVNFVHPEDSTVGARSKIFYIKNYSSTALHFFINNEKNTIHYLDPGEDMYLGDACTVNIHSFTIIDAGCSLKWYAIL